MGQQNGRRFLNKRNELPSHDSRQLGCYISATAELVGLVRRLTRIWNPYRQSSLENEMDMKGAVSTRRNSQRFEE